MIVHCQSDSIHIVIITNISFGHLKAEIFTAVFYLSIMLLHIVMFVYILTHFKNMFACLNFIYKHILILKYIYLLQENFKGNCIRWSLR